MTQGWEHFEHGADIGVRGFGASKAQAFEQAAMAMTAVITEPSRVLPRQSVEIVCEAVDDETLFVAWLNALIYEMAVRHMLFGHFEVHLDGHRVQASASGEPVAPLRHRPAVEVKGATYTALHVGQAADGQWFAQTVVDV